MGGELGVVRFVSGWRRLSRPGISVGVACVALLVAATPGTPAPAPASPTPYARPATHLPAAPVRDFMAQAAVAAVGDRNAAAQAAPAGEISDNVEFLSNLPELETAISAAFIDDIAYVSTVTGLYSVDISDPANPVLVGAAPQFIWENEHMTADPVRKRVFITRDPRGYTSPATSGGTFPEGAVEIYDVSNPAAMLLVGYVRLPAGHTSTCLGNCDYLWTMGPASGSFNPPDWHGRPVFGTDITNALTPVDCPGPLDLNSNDGVTDYAHSVDPDANGVAWVSGRGHVRGFWVEGDHLNPVTGNVETATPCAPIPYGGGGTNEGNANEGIMHNSFHNLTASVDGRAGDVVMATEEDVTSNCDLAGRFMTFDIGGSYQGQGWINTDQTHFRIPSLGYWTPEGQPGSSGCDSAHWFTDRGDALVAIAFYSQGTRLLDVSNPRDIRQVGYYVPTSTNSWAAYWRPQNLVVVTDFGRGLDIFRYHDEVSVPVGPPSVRQPPAAAAVAPAEAPAGDGGAGGGGLPNTAGFPRGAALAIGAAALLLVAVGAGLPRRRREV
ncbi:MAG: hypothetical protein QOE92_1468 [Chloroflexota bacterium]|jgi:hypothetical protein|nr:hypothetical protein [Chloroflexota bacterium]